MQRRFNLSMVRVFGRIRQHHREYTDCAVSPQACLQFLQLWVAQDRWIREMIAPSVMDAFSMEAFRELGVGRDMLVSVPFRDWDDGEWEAEVTDTQQTFVYHVRLTMSAVKQMLRYTIATRAPPWRFAAFILGGSHSPPEDLEYMARLSAFVERLFSSQDPRHGQETPG